MHSHLFVHNTFSMSNPSDPADVATIKTSYCGVSSTLLIECVKL